MNQLPATLGIEVVEKLALAGDVSGLTKEEKIQYYRALCERLGLDPATQPFKLLRLSGKEVFYCDRSGAQQLSRLHAVSHEVRAREVHDDCYVVTARASSNGRSTESIGAVPIKGLAGEALCNAYMKAETKAKRRSTLDLLGLGMLDESEVSSIPGAVTVDLPPATIINSAPKQLPAPKTKASPAPNSGTVAHGPSADHETYAKVLRGMSATPEVMRLAEAYGKKCLSKFIGAVAESGPREVSLSVAWSIACGRNWIIPTEELANIPLDKVPLSKAEFDGFMAELKEVSSDHHAVSAAINDYAETHPLEPEPPPEVQAAIDQGTQTPRTPKDDEWWREVIVPVPRKDQKRADYLDNPDTIGSLFDARHGNDDESALARRRLFGFVNGYEAKGWTGRDGKTRPPSPDDVKFREALTAFDVWFKANHPNEKL